MSDRGNNWKFNRNRGNKSFRGGRHGKRPFYRDQRDDNGSYGRNSGGFRGGRGLSNYRGQNNHWKNRPKRDTPGKRLSEEDIGVTEYISEHEGFLGIIKSRYSDFQVAELNESGELAQLTTTVPPTPPADELVVEDEDLLLSKYNLELLPMETWDSINTMAVNAGESDDKVEVDVTGMTKEQRTKIHDAVKKAFGDNIVGSTVSVDDKKFVQFVKYRKGVRIDNRVKWPWPHDYVYFIVHKENCDTMEAASRIAERLRLNIKPSMLGYAGTKDRRAKTSQWFSLRKVDPRKIAAACRDMRDITVGNFDFKPVNLRLGMLKGNQFRIALRNVTVPNDIIDVACNNLKELGFINYYGLQRFGSRVETPTYQVGLKLLQGNFKEAIDSILEEREGVIQAALHAYKIEGAAAALRAWPRRDKHHGIELRLIKALATCPNDLLGALDKLARNTRLLYLHSYQSLIWNRCVSERLKRWGLKPCVGDLVPLQAAIEEEIVEAQEIDDEDNETEDSESVSDKQNGDNENKMVDGDDKMADAPVPLETSIKQVKQKVPVKVLTQEDVDCGKYTISDVILPLPGNMVDYPPNMKEYYEELLAKDGLNLEMKHKFKCYTMSGAYRHVVVRPLDVSWRTVHYTDPHADLIPSDKDKLEGRTIADAEDGKYKALLLTMTLPASCYATMALRELLKVDTSCDNQALQNNYHKKKETDDVVPNEGEKDGDIKSDVKEEVGECNKRKLEGDGEIEAKKLKQEVE